MRNIKSFCPDVTRWIEVMDDWYPSYKIRSKLYVQASIRVYEVEIESAGEEINERGYMIYCSFWGADDMYMAKEIFFDNQNQAIVEYKKLRKLLSKLTKQKTKELKPYLRKLGFVHGL